MLSTASPRRKRRFLGLAFSAFHHVPLGAVCLACAFRAPFQCPCLRLEPPFGVDRVVRVSVSAETVESALLGVLGFGASLAFRSVSWSSTDAPSAYTIYHPTRWCATP